MSNFFIRRPIVAIVIAIVTVLAGRPRRFAAVDFHEGTGHIHVPLHRVKNEELGFRAEEGGVTQAARFFKFRQRLIATGFQVLDGYVTKSITIPELAKADPTRQYESMTLQIDPQLALVILNRDRKSTRLNSSH